VSGFSRTVTPGKKLTAENAEIAEKDLLCVLCDLPG
jgi:hypothetical protein